MTLSPKKELTPLPIELKKLMGTIFHHLNVDSLQILGEATNNAKNGFFTTKIPVAGYGHSFQQDFQFENDALKNMHLRTPTYEIRAAYENGKPKEKDFTHEESWKLTNRQTGTTIVYSLLDPQHTVLHLLESDKHIEEVFNQKHDLILRRARHYGLNERQMRCMQSEKSHNLTDRPPEPSIILKRMGLPLEVLALLSLKPLTKS